MTIYLLTTFPDYFTSSLACSILKRAQDRNLVEFRVINLRQFTTDKRQTTDDRPFGGGPGMVMQIEPIDRALSAHSLVRGQADSRIILTSAKGKQFTQATASSYAQLKSLAIICGHYEGVDERVADHLIDEEVRIGEYVLTGGEPAAVVMSDAITRLIPGVLGNDESNQQESHSQPGLLSHPVYTRPEIYQDWAVPEVLLGGDHQAIAAWRQKQRQQSQG
jgi:tRNA (guanine37-N1)-methyltransferase